MAKVNDRIVNAWPFRIYYFDDADPPQVILTRAALTARGANKAAYDHLACFDYGQVHRCEVIDISIGKPHLQMRVHPDGRVEVTFEARAKAWRKPREKTE